MGDKNSNFTQVHKFFFYRGGVGVLLFAGCRSMQGVHHIFKSKIQDIPGQFKDKIKKNPGQF